LNGQEHAAYGLAMPSSTPLGQYLQARRALIQPEDVQLRRFGVRRVPGLRREELAMLAGISPNYYVRLEQGQDQRPSREVLDALARALQLDHDATVFLHSLGQPPPTPTGTNAPETAPASIERLINTWRTTPAFVHNRHLDVLAANPISVALRPTFIPGANCLREVFLDPQMLRFYGDWENVAQSAVARLRGLIGKDVDNPRLAALVAELSERSPDFTRLWARHDIRLTPPDHQIFNHDIVGTIELKPERLAIVGTNGQLLIVSHAQPGSPSEQALERLASSTTHPNAGRVSNQVG
jgi:transcriptional regulator with XRE-family HTH domain